MALLVLTSAPSLAAAAAACYGGTPNAYREPQAPLADGALEATATRVTGSPESLLELVGNVQLHYQNTGLRADRALLNTQTMDVSTEGAASLFTENFSLHAEQLNASLGGSNFSIDNANFELFGSSNYLRGSSEEFNQLSDQAFELRKAIISSCAEEQETWRLRAAKVTIDETTGRGKADGVRFELLGVPLFYLPWLSWPLNDDRQTGLLYPHLAFSDASGWEFHAPWYWNIAPNMDLTLTPRVLEKRGVQFKGEFRALTARSSWQLDYEYLNDREFSKQRQFYKLSQSGTLNRHWRSRVVISDASDSDYFGDLGNRSAVSNVAHLDRRIDLHFDDGQSKGLVRLQAHQTLDETLPLASRPYKRLPQLTWSSTAWSPPGPFSLSVEGEAVQLTKEQSVKTWRLDARPRFMAQYASSAGFVKSSATLAHTRYWLSDEDETAASEMSRTVPTFSLDMGLRMRRDMPGQATQTLEPRLFYLYTPARNQSDLPLFDTGKLDFSYDQLFRENRYSGRDRIGDANQLSLAMSSRYLNAKGEEVWRTSLGSAFYLNDQEVTLEDETVTSGQSDLIAEAMYSGQRNWQLRAIAQFDPDDRELERTGIDLRYRSDKKKIFNLGHRLQRDRLEQLDVSFAWPFENSVTLLGVSKHSIRDNRSIEHMLGVSWDSCCWTLRGSAHRQLQANSGDYENRLSFEMVFKGLGGLGNNVGAQFNSSILGYAGAKR